MARPRYKTLLLASLAAFMLLNAGCGIFRCREKRLFHRDCNDCNQVTAAPPVAPCDPCRQ